MNIARYGSIEELTADVVLPPEEQKKIDALDSVIQRDPNNLLARMLLTRRSLTILHRNSLKRRGEKGFLLYQAQADGRAIKELNKVLALDPHYVDAYVWLAELLLFHWALLRRMVALRSLMRLRRTGQKQDNASQFVYCMQKAIELEPTWPHPPTTP